MDLLLTRDQFREGVFARDKGLCVICKAPAKDAHHILERRLFSDGGYYLNNGASLCEIHHLEAESTTLSCQTIRGRAGITSIILPPHLYRDQQYDKWGNPILDNGTRLPGDLFNDESVQKVIAPVLSLFTHHVKYPRTYHLPWSPGLTKDDRVMTDLSGLEGEECIATVKMDGENTTMYQDYIHARSLEYSSHPSRNRIKAMHAQVQSDIPEGWRVCGENLFAKHSIHYQNLLDYFLVFSIWNDKNVCLPWDETVEWASLLGLKHVPILWRGIWDEEVIRNLYQPTYNGDSCEGYVVRVTKSFHYREFRQRVGKYVRKNHVQTHAFWMHQTVTPNKIKE